MSVMNDSDITILERHDDHVIVGSDMLSYMKDYPESIEDDGTVYHWAGNVPMDNCYTGHYFGTAKYERVNHAES